MRKYVFIFLFVCINAFLFSVTLPNDSEIISIVKITIEQNNAPLAWMADSTTAIKNTAVNNVEIKEKSQDIKEEYAIRELRSDGEFGLLYYADIAVFDNQQVEKMKNDGWQVGIVYMFDVIVTIQGTCLTKASTKKWNKSAFEVNSTFTFRKAGKRDWDCAVWK